MLASGHKAQSNSAAPKGGRRNGRAATAERYEVLERRGEGTLWIVYRVRERAPQNDGNGDAAPQNGAGLLALKALRSVANRHPRLPNALAQTLSRWEPLSHPNLATPHNVGIEDDTLYFTTQWLPAPALEARLERGAVPIADALRILHQIAGALAYLHEQNLPHGDVRLRQIMFNSKGAAILSDGGIAAAFADAGLALADVQSEIPLYLAPERSQGESLSGPADVYALGVCFYQMLCGRVPFDGASPLAIAARHRNEAPTPPSQFNARISSDIDELALRLLEKDPAERPTAAQLETLLQPHTVRALDNSAPAMVSTVVDVGAPDADAPTTEPDDVVAAAPIGPRRRPLDEVVAETMSQEAQAKRAQFIKSARRKHRWREFGGALGALLWLLIMAGALGGLIYGTYNLWIGEIPAEVVVPRYIGQSSESARQLLSKKGLSMKITREAYDPKKPAGTVLAGEPEPGRKVRAKREVLVTVSAGTAPIKMVDFSKLSLDQARQIILQHGLRLGSTIEQYHPVVPRGYICGQYPEVGAALRRSEPITLIVSRGPQPTEIDAQKNLTPDEELTTPPTNGASGIAPAPGTDFAPLEPADNAPVANDAPNNPTPETPTAPVSNELKTKRVTIKVNIPRGGGRQTVRIVVRDANGERTVYQRSRPAGSSVSRTVRATRPDSDPALVRVYVGDELVREDNL